MIPAKGLHLSERYHLQERISIGGMGEVWVAWDAHLHRQVAAKVLRAEFVGDKAFLDRLRAEARNAAGVSHQNIAAMYDYGEQAGSGFLIMELVHGEPLSELLEREGSLDPAQLLPVLAQAARALHTAHLGGVVHRDIKPANILLTPDGYVKLTDFGISLAPNQAPMTEAGMVMGTAQYLPPEQAMGRAATGAGDIYALGVVAYEALVGSRPFTGKSQVDIAFAHVNQALPPLPESIDPRVRAIVEQMLAKDPEQRPRSGASLARSLEHLATQLDVELEPSQARRATDAVAAEAIGTREMPSVAVAADATQASPSSTGLASPTQPASPTGTASPDRTASPATPEETRPVDHTDRRTSTGPGRRRRLDPKEGADDAPAQPRWHPVTPEEAEEGEEGEGEAGRSAPATSSGLNHSRSPQPRSASLPATRRALRRAAERAERMERARRRRPGTAGHASAGLLSYGMPLALAAVLLLLVLLGRLGEATTALAVALPLISAPGTDVGAPRVKE